MRKKLLPAAAAALLTAAGFGVALVIAGGAGSTVTTTSTISKSTETVSSSSTTITSPKTTTITVKTTTAAQPSLQPQCKLARPQPNDPLELNTVAAGGQAKTIVMEKQVLECTKSNGGQQVRDLQTFIEVFEQAGPGGLSITATRVIATMCIKDLDVGSITCSHGPVPLGPTLSKPLAGCVPSDDQPGDPVQMNSKGVGDWFKTVAVDKQVLFCPNEGVSDLYLFTELVSDNPPTGGPTTRTFGGIICVEHPADGRPVDSCNRVSTG